MDNLGNSFISQTPAIEGSPGRVDLIRDDFNTFVWDKGLEVYHDKAIKCPCRNVKDAQGLSGCKNCGGSGWVFVNRTRTKMVLQSINKETKFKDWSEEKIGTVKVTAMHREKLSHMDRITIPDADVFTSQVLFPRLHQDGKLRCYSVYDIKSVELIYFFESITEKLRVLTTDEYTIIDGQWIELSDDFLTVDNPTISIRYSHSPMFHIIDFSRNITDTFELEKTSDLNRDKYKKLPILATGRIAHYVIDQENFSGDYLFNNTFVTCDKTIVININNRSITFNSFPQQEIDLFDLDQYSGNIIFNETTKKFQGYNGSKWIVFDWDENIESTAVLTALPSSFIEDTTFASVNLNVTSANIDASLWMPSGLRDGAVVQIKKLSGDGVIKFTDHNGTTYDFVNKIGEFITLKYDQGNNRFLIN